MQHSTTMRPNRKIDGVAVIGVLAFVATLLAATVAIWQAARPAAPAAPDIAVGAPRPLGSAFADEAAYVAPLAEYASPAIGEDYLPLAAPAAAAVAAPRPLGSAFADEAAYVAPLAEYTSPAIGEDYLPLAAPAAQPAQRLNRFFADELAGAAQGDTQVYLGGGSVSEPIVTLAGPR